MIIIIINPNPNLKKKNTHWNTIGPLPADGAVHVKETLFFTLLLVCVTALYTRVSHE